MQVIDASHRRIIEYASKQFNATQRRYATIEQEATDIFWALRKWKHFLLGCGFTLETDHRPLQWLNNKIDAGGKFGRMTMNLEQFQPYKNRTHSG